MQLKLKSTLFAGVLTATMAVPAFASNAPNIAPVVEHLPQFTAADTHMLFEQDAMPMQLAALSDKEMKETEGALFNPWGAVGGAIWGGGSVIMNNIGRGMPVRQWNAGTIFVGAGAGALSGGFAHMRPIAAYVVPRVTLVGSFAAGRRGW